MTIYSAYSQEYMHHGHEGKVYFAKKQEAIDFAKEANDYDWEIEKLTGKTDKVTLIDLLNNTGGFVSEHVCTIETTFE